MLLFMTSEDEKGQALSWSTLNDKAFSLRFVVIVAALITLIGGLNYSPFFSLDFSISPRFAKRAASAAGRGMINEKPYL